VRPGTINNKAGKRPAKLREVDAEHAEETENPAVGADSKRLSAPLESSRFIAIAGRRRNSALFPRASHSTNCQQVLW
jgi:hypothetical protein